VSFVTTTADPDRKVIWSNLTGTIPSYRGQGLAKVVKSAALNRSREAGFLAAFTGNDAGNKPMLAVNEWLGYRPTAAAWTAEKVL
jgi:RimJ/RimL family protein N-acetyltransferase